MVLDGLTFAIESVILNTSWELGLGVCKALLDSLSHYLGAKRCRSTDDGT